MTILGGDTSSCTIGGLTGSSRLCKLGEAVIRNLAAFCIKRIEIILHKHSTCSIIRIVIDRHFFHARDTDRIAHSLSGCSIFQRSTHRFSLRAWNTNDNTPTPSICNTVHSFLRIYIYIYIA
jgi:hypothetical protein